MITDVEPTLPTQEEIDSFKAPKTLVGQQVLFYPHAIKNSRRPSLGFVTWTGQSDRIINILEFDGNRILLREAVRHIDDPKLQLNNDQREFGAWDFTPFDKEDRKWKEETTEHLRVMDEAFLGTGKSDRDYLMFHARRLGLTGYSTKKSEEVREMILSATQGVEETKAD